MTLRRILRSHATILRPTLSQEFWQSNIVRKAPYFSEVSIQYDTEYIYSAWCIFNKHCKREIWDIHILARIACASCVPKHYYINRTALDLLQSNLLLRWTSPHAPHPLDEQAKQTIWCCIHCPRTSSLNCVNVSLYECYAVCPMKYCGLHCVTGVARNP